MAFSIISLVLRRVQAAMGRIKSLHFEGKKDGQRRKASDKNKRRLSVREASQVVPSRLSSYSFYAICAADTIIEDYEKADFDYDADIVLNETKCRWKKLTRKERLCWREAAKRCHTESIHRKYLSKTDGSASEQESPSEMEVDHDKTAAEQYHSSMKTSSLPNLMPAGHSDATSFGGVKESLLGHITTLGEKPFEELVEAKIRPILDAKVTGQFSMIEERLREYIDQQLQEHRSMLEERVMTELNHRLRLIQAQPTSAVPRLLSDSSGKSAPNVGVTGQKQITGLVPSCVTVDGHLHNQRSLPHSGRLHSIDNPAPLALNSSRGLLCRDMSNKYAETPVQDRSVRRDMPVTQLPIQQTNPPMTRSIPSNASIPICVSPSRGSQLSPSARDLTIFSRSCSLPEIFGFYRPIDEKFNDASLGFPQIFGAISSTSSWKDVNFILMPHSAVIDLNNHSSMSFITQHGLTVLPEFTNLSSKVEAETVLVVGFPPPSTKAFDPSIHIQSLRDFMLPELTYCSPVIQSISCDDSQEIAVFQLTKPGQKAMLHQYQFLGLFQIIKVECLPRQSTQLATELASREAPFTQVMSSHDARQRYHQQQVLWMTSQWARITIAPKII